MRALHLHSGNLFGGVETFLLTLAKGCAAAPAMEMTAGLCFEGRAADELRAAGVRTIVFGEVRLRRPDQMWRVRHALRALLATGTFDVAVCHQPWALAVFGPVVRRAGVPLVAWIHMAPERREWVDRLAARVEPDLYICNSRFTASALGAGSERTAVVYLPVEAGPSTDRAERREPVVIIQVSRMEPWKGQRLCLEALAMLDAEPRWEYWVAGGAQRPDEQRYADELRAFARAKGIDDRVIFLGQRNDVRELLQRADIFCQPNLQPEPFGISLVEALYAGLPVVTSAAGGALEIVDDTCGVLVPPGDASALSSALGRMVGDRAARLALGARGPARAAALCDPVRQTREIERVLERVASREAVH